MEKIDCKKKPNKRLAEEMIKWGKIMGSLKMVPYVTEKGWAGNIGFRDNDVIWVTPSGGIINNTKLEDIVGITERKDMFVYWNCLDKKPTSEWEIYWTLFDKRRDINSILHGHDLFVLETAETLNKQYPGKVALTKSITDAGSKEFRDEIAEIITNDNIYLIGRHHGFFSLGKTFEDAGMLALEFRSKAGELMIGEEHYQTLLDKYHIG